MKYIFLIILLPPVCSQENNNMPINFLYSGHYQSFIHTFPDQHMQPFPDQHTQPSGGSWYWYLCPDLQHKCNLCNSEEVSVSARTSCFCPACSGKPQQATPTYFCSWGMNPEDSGTIGILITWRLVIKIHFLERCGCMTALLHYCMVLPANTRKKLGSADALQETGTRGGWWTEN